MSTKNNLSFLKDRRSTIDQRARGYVIRTLLVLLPMLTLGVLATPTNAQVQARTQERIINYQAQVLRDGELLRDGVYDIVATLYSDPDGRTQVWRSTYAAQVRNGIVNLNLGDVRDGGSPLPNEGLDGAIYLGIGIGRSPGEPAEEMRPLTRISSVLNALTVADSSITKEKLATSYVEKILINSDTIEGKAATLSLRAGPGISIVNTGKNNYLIGTQGERSDLSGTGPAWTEDGNNTLAGTAFLGTSDASPLPIKVNGLRVMHYSPNAISPIILGGDLALNS